MAAVKVTRWVRQHTTVEIAVTTQAVPFGNTVAVEHLWSVDDAINDAISQADWQTDEETADDYDCERLW